MADAGDEAPRGAPSAPVTVVTGATEGLGLALAREFLKGGRDVLLVARDQPRLEAVADGLCREFDKPVHALACDLASAECGERIESAVRRNGLHVEFLVNNAGAGLAGAFAEASRERLDALLALNVRAPTDLTRRFLPGMIGRNGGGVLNVGSLGGFLPGPYQAAYYASKAYLLSLTEALACETAGTKVRVAVLMPGPLNTEFHRRMGGASAYYLRFLGVMGSEAAARIGYANFMCGQRVIVPGIYNLLAAVAARLTPHFVLNPMTAWLLRPRDGKGDA